MNIIELIPFDHYITRDELVSATGMSDRAVRREIQRLRESSTETVIISNSGNRGYKRPRSYEELEAVRNESLSRIRAEQRKINKINLLLNNKDQYGLGIK